MALFILESDFIKKQILAKAAALILSGAALITCAHAESVGFNNEGTLVSNARAAYDSKYTNISWQLEAAENVGAPVVYGDSVLIPCGSSIVRYSEENGTKMAEIRLNSPVCADYSGVVSGSVLVQPLESGICTVDFTDGSVTTRREFGKIGSSIAVIDDMAYFAADNGSGETFYCVSLDGSLTTLWQYEAAEDITSPTVQGDFVIFGAGENLVVCHYKDGTANEIPLGGKITAAPFASQYAVFAVLSDTTVKLRLNADGSMEEDSLLSCHTGENSSAPLVYNSRLYITSAEGLHIIDSINMEIIETLPDIKNGSDPFICRGNGTRVYTIADYNGGMALHSVYDAGEENEPADAILAVLENYDGGKSAVSDNGTMYFRDGTGRIYALTRVEYDIFTMVIKLVLLAALIVCVFIWLRLMGKRKEKSQPRF